MQTPQKNEYEMQFGYVICKSAKHQFQHNIFIFWDDLLIMSFGFYVVILVRNEIK